MNKLKVHRRRQSQTQYKTICTNAVLIYQNAFFLDATLILRFIISMIAVWEAQIYKFNLVLRLQPKEGEGKAIDPCTINMLNTWW